MEYRDFLKAKVRLHAGVGFEVPLEEINPALKPHTRAMVQWALRGGRRALFASFGLHKTAAQLEIMRLIGIHRPRPRLIVLPLGVRQEFVLDAAEHFKGKYAIGVQFIRSIEEMDGGEAPIYLTNYESIREGVLDISGFGKTFGEFLFGPAMQLEFRFVATATPDPNDFLELIAYAHFLGVMDMGESKTRFFKRNSEQADELTLHPHKEEEFWLWVSSWALFVQQPSDLGFSDEGYALPALDVRWHEIGTDHAAAGSDKSGQGRMFKNSALGVVEAAREKRDSLPARTAKLLELRAEDPDAHRLIWHDLEAERASIEDEVPGVCTIYGTQDLEERERLMLGFRNGEIQEMAAKPVMLGAGGNLQRHCWWAIYLGIGHKFNDFIQSIHRLQRFGQTNQVRVDLIYTEAEREVRRSLEAKWARHEKQAEIMSQIIRKYGLAQVGLEHALTRSMGVTRQEASGKDWTLVNNDSVEEFARMPADSLGMILTSIPFSTQYEYSPSYNDFGHTDDEEHFFRQMDFLTPHLVRALKPGRVLAVHCKDRVVPGAMNGIRFQVVSRFHSRVGDHYEKHGLWFLGEKIITTDVVRENAQTYRLGYSNVCKDASRIGCGMPEYLLLFRKAPTDSGQGFADERVVKSKVDYARARWQYDAHGFQRSSGNRFLRPEDLKGLKHGAIYKLFKQHSIDNVYNFERDVQIAEALQRAGNLPTDYFLVPPQSWHPDVWSDVTRMRTLNSDLARRGVEKHLCPLQFDIADRAINLYSNPGDIVADPFSGIGTVPLRAMKLGRIGWGCELAAKYWQESVWIARREERELGMPSLFDVLQEEAA